MSLINVEVSPDYVGAYKKLKPVLSQVAEILHAYIRFDRKRLVFLSTSNLSIGFKTTST